MADRRILQLIMVFSLATTLVLADEVPSGSLCQLPAADVDPGRSLLVTELDVLEQALSLEDVLTAIAEDVGNPAFGSGTLWQQLWDSQNLGPGLGLGFNCDDELDSTGAPAINGFPIQCPRNEGSEVNVDPFDPGLPSYYKLIALVNRMDRAPLDGANCGDFRAIFARSGGSRNHISFEAVLPNPEPGCGLEGCRAVALFWERLSCMDDPDRRAATLRRFFLRGVPNRGIEPVIRAAHFSVGSGQIRTNQDMRGPAQQRWLLREFKLAQLCPTGVPCIPVFVPVTVKQSPFGELFDETKLRPGTIPFQRHFMRQVQSLSVPDIFGFSAEAPDYFNAGQNSSQGIESEYAFHFANSPYFASALTARLSQIGSTLSPIHLVRRSMALSCAGCHELNNNAPDNDLGDGIIWPSSLGFVHISELQTTLIDGSEHFAISPALEDVFIPERKRIFEAYLDSVICATCGTVSQDIIPPVSPLAITVGPDGRPDIKFTPQALRALDDLLKSGGAPETLGGPGYAH